MTATPQEPAMGVSDVIAEMRVLAADIARAGINGFGNRVTNVADKLAALPHMQPAGKAVAWQAHLGGRWISVPKGAAAALAATHETRALAVQGVTPPQPSAEPQPEALQVGPLLWRIEQLIETITKDVPEEWSAMHAGRAYGVQENLLLIAQLIQKAATQPAPVDVRNLLRRFHSDTSGLPEEWQDWRNDFMRAIAALLSAQPSADAGDDAIAAQREAASA